eukprot:Rhum_TRINITY_DN14169_c3_g1::Rhum_TRINITY_DN14169_c3_g1_i1::g.71922::m.71922
MWKAGPGSRRLCLRRNGQKEFFGCSTLCCCDCCCATARKTAARSPCPASCARGADPVLKRTFIFLCCPDAVFVRQESGYSLLGGGGSVVLLVLHVHHTRQLQRLRLFLRGLRLRLAWWHSGRNVVLEKLVLELELLLLRRHPVLVVEEVVGTCLVVVRVLRGRRHPLEPSVQLLVVPPRGQLQLSCCQVLLVRPLLVVEGKEQRVCLHVSEGRRLQKLRVQLLRVVVRCLERPSCVRGQLLRVLRDDEVVVRVQQKPLLHQCVLPALLLRLLLRLLLLLLCLLLQVRGSLGHRRGQGCLHCARSRRRGESCSRGRRGVLSGGGRHAGGRGHRRQGRHLVQAVLLGLCGGSLALGLPLHLHHRKLLLKLCGADRGRDEGRCEGGDAGQACGGGCCCCRGRRHLLHRLGHVRGNGELGRVVRLGRRQDGGAPAACGVAGVGNDVVELYHFVLDVANVDVEVVQVTFVLKTLVLQLLVGLHHRVHFARGAGMKPKNR